MKNATPLTVSLCAFLLLTSTVQAQSKWSAGYRTGAEMIDIVAEPYLDLKENILWTNELFVNRTIGKRLESEIAIRFNRNSYSDSFFTYDSYGPTSEIHNISRISLQLTARYHFIQKAKYSIYGQAGTTIQRRRESIDATQYNIFNENSYTISTTYNKMQWLNRINIGAGINYNLSSNIYLSFTAIAGYRTDQTSYMNAYREGSTAWCANALFGFGYRF